MPQKKTPPSVRFWRQVVKTETCWLWRGVERTRHKACPYGNFDNHRAHRYSWELVYGPIPEGLHVLHKCDVPCCVRPDYLFLGTHQDNMDDMGYKGRRVIGEAVANKGEKNPKAKLTEESVVQIRKLSGVLPSRKVAALFGIEKTAVLRIWKGERWNHI